MNTFANSRTAFASLRGKPYPVYAIPLKAGMSIGMLLISIELAFMLGILTLVPHEYAGKCFIGFAIGESLGAAALRVAGGIFTKIADIGSDLMKIVFKIKEDDARNPGVIADCTGDNAGDSVGPSADGFETYGVTGVALIVFILLAVRDPTVQVQLLMWIFVMRILMIISSALATSSTRPSRKARYGNADKMNFEPPLTQLVWITSIVSVVFTFAASYVAHPDARRRRHAVVEALVIITCGTLAGAIIPELVKVFTSTESAHVREVVTSSREGGASLNILSGLTAGNFSAFWMGMVLIVLMGIGVLRQPDGPRRDDDRRQDGRLAGLRLRPRGLRLPRHGPGHDRGRLVRPGHRQRAERLRALGHRDASRTSRRRSRRTSASTSTSRRPSTASRRTTARATPSRRRRSRSSSAPRSSARRR